jgi:DNA helicase-2/ATP-dependent DNA helicase PcrA
VLSADDDLLFPPPDEPPSEPAFVAELNEPQARAATHVDGPLLVFAGAGSGKTRVITYRIANLVATHRVPPYRILAVTFTNKAAGEMRHRLEGLIGADVTRDLWVGTFHAICARLLRTVHEAAGLQKNFVIYDDGDQRAVMNRVLKELELDDKRYPPKQMLSRIHKEKQEGRSPADFMPESWLDEAVAKCFAAYERHLRSANAVDFDDLLLAVLRVAEDPDSLVGDSLRKKFRYVLVDEFQDVNQVQYRLVRAFAGETQNLCVVGDDDQSIYGWRGADVRNIRGFRRDFPGAVVVKLEQNYRSTGNVVSAALGVIRSAASREPKELWTSNPPGDPILVVATQSEREEAAWVAERIAALVARGVDAREIAVFYRIHAQSRVLEEVLRSERIPYQIIGGMRFFERAEIKDVLSYLRVVDNPRSDVDLARIINVPSRKIGQATVQRLVEMADSLGTSLYDALGPLVERGGLGTAAKRSLLGFHDLMQALMREARTASPRLLAEEIVERTGYRKHLEQDDSAESDARLQNIDELLGSLAEYEEEVANAGEVATLAGYLERVSLQGAVDTLEETPKVAMMTVHGAKGLEFTAVFLTGMEEEMFPYRGLDAEHADELEEERRLAYVAITRARRALAITHAQTRTIFGRTRYSTPSRFIADLPAPVVRPIVTAGASSLSSRFASGSPVSVGPRTPWAHPQADAVARGPQREAARPLAPPKPLRAPGERYIEREEDGSTEGGLHVASRVLHAKYGAGVVVEVDAGADPIVTVKFSGGWGTKRIKASFLRTA